MAQTMERFLKFKICFISFLKQRKKFLNILNGASNFISNRKILLEIEPSISLRLGKVNKYPTTAIGGKFKLRVLIKAKENIFFLKDPN